MKASTLKAIKKKAVEILSMSEEKFTPLRMENELAESFADKKVVKKALRELVLQGDLFYTYLHGCSFIEKSVNKPLNVSNRVLLVPAGMSAGCDQGRVAIRIAHGGSFGNGDHPTTRLSIRGLDFVLSQKAFQGQAFKKRALDIGTGSGVLAITAVKLGIKKALGVDIDAVARQEALENVRINGLTEQIEITGTGVDTISGKFSIISANLRTPTLKQLVPHVARMLISGGAVVLSGIRAEECLSIRTLYEGEGFRCVREEFETGWVGLVFEERVP